MAKDSKFGTFGGVFTPSILTILGVIMYLRLPMVVGEAGLAQTLLIIAMAHVVSFTTGMSISSIATDKSVGAGGPYYIVSRSLGLPIGGTLGLALFVGLCFSISLYIIGFSESLLPIVGLVERGAEIPVQMIRICGTVTLVALTAITLISTSLAIKTQYVILGAIAISLIAIFAGDVPPELAAQVSDGMPVGRGGDASLLFAVFFPAVTGFTAGVNMSGDLRDPKRSIPIGTMAAIVTGAAVYVGLTVFLAFKVSPEALATNPELLQDIALNPWAVTAGIWGATLSSALGSILGGPRILQAVATDGIVPKILAKGTGPSNEPRNALIFACMIGEAGILIAELDAIAKIVSMVFLATYGFLNLCSFIESWANPDFRPSWKINKIWSLIGAIACLGLMIQLDPIAMVGSTALLAGLFLFLERKQLRLESGDTWEGIWASVVRAGLHRLGRKPPQIRQWRPNVLMFSREMSETRGPMLRFATSLISGRGMLTEFVLTAKHGDSRIARNTTIEAQDELPIGVFSRLLPSDDLHESIRSACRFHGFSGLEPNTVLLDWAAHQGEEADFPALLGNLHDLDLNVLVFARNIEGRGSEHKTIDVWWAPDEGNFSLSLSLLRFVTSSQGWGHAQLRFMLVSNDVARSDDLRRTASGLLEEARISASVTVFSAVRSLEVLMAEESGSTALTIAGIPSQESGERTLARMKYVASRLPRVLFLEASKTLPDALHMASAQSEVSVSLRGAFLNFADLSLPKAPELALVAKELDEGYQELVSELHEHGIARVYGLNLELLAKVGATLDRHFATLEKGVKGANLVKRRKVVNRVQSSFLIACRELLSGHTQDILRDQASAMSGRIEAFLLATRSVLDEQRAPVRVSSERMRFSANPNDSRYLRRFKRRRRFHGWLRREDPYYYVPLVNLQVFYFETSIKTILHRTLATFCADSHRMMVELGKTINASETSLTMFSDDATDREFLGEVVERREALKDHFSQIQGIEQARVEALRKEILAQAHQIAQGFADDLGELDVRDLIRKKRRPPTNSADVRGDLQVLVAQWKDRQGLLLDRAKLGLQVSTVQHRLATVAHKIKQTLALDIRNGTLAGYEFLRSALSASLDKLGEGDVLDLAGSYEFPHRFDGKPVIDGLVQQAGGWLTELPENYETLTGPSIQGLTEGSRDDTELVSVSVRRLVHQVIESQFIGTLQEDLAEIPRVESHAIQVAQDVVRLVRFNFAEAELVRGLDAEGVEASQQELVGVLKNALERIDGELVTLRELGPRIALGIERRLEASLQSMDVYELALSDDGFNREILRQQGRVLGWVKTTVVTVQKRVRDATVNILYRRSAGVLLARRLREGDDATTIVDRMSDFSSARAPRPEILKDLPFYYRQIFFRQSLVNESFWVGRDEQLARARHAIAAHRRGGAGTLVIRGTLDSGKSALCRKIIAGPLAKQKIFRVVPPAAGEIDVEVFRRMFAAAVESIEGTNEDGYAGAAVEPGSVGGRRDLSLLESVPQGSVIVLEDLELWWERSVRGWAVVDCVLGLIREASAHCLFVIEINSHAFTYINRFRPLSDTALAVLDCGPMPAESLKEIVMLRHGSTGMKLQLEGNGEDELAALDFARLFSRYFDYTGGHVGASLRAWVSNVSKVEKNLLHVQFPVIQAWDVLDEIRVEWTAILVQLFLHKRAGDSRLRRITGMDEDEIGEHLSALIRSGLVVEDGRGVYEINPFVGHLLVDRLRKRGLLP